MTMQRYQIDRYPFVLCVGQQGVFALTWLFLFPLN
jgi:hypothetical protein